MLNRSCLPRLAAGATSSPSWCCYRLTLRDLSEIMALRGIVLGHETFREWEVKLLPIMGDALRRRRQLVC